MKLKILLYTLFFAFFAVSCSESMIDNEPLTQKQPNTTQLKSSLIGTNYYVAKNGSNTNPGTLLKPFLTIQKGIDIAKAGDTVFVRVGTYQEYVTFKNSGTVGNPIVLKKYNSDLVTIDGMSSRAYCIYASNKSNIVVDGFNIRYSTSYNIQFAGCQNITVKNVASALSVASTAKNIVINPSTENWGKNITIQNITTTGGAYGLIFGTKLNGVNIMGGRFSNASVDGMNLQAGSVTDSTKFNRNILVDGVEIDHNKRQGIVTWGMINSKFRNFKAHDNGATGIQIENLCHNIVIEDFICNNNSLTWSYETGCWIDDSDGIIVRRGIMRDNQTGFRVSFSTNVLAYDLLIYSNQDGMASGLINSSGLDFSSSRVELYNSVLDGNCTTTSQRGSVSLRDTGYYVMKNVIISNDKSARDIFRSGTHTLISDYNLVFNTRAVNVYYNPSTAYNAPMTWSAYKTASKQEVHSVISDPKFNSIANSDYKLQATSPAINKGYKIPGITTDFTNRILSGIQDIGAYEH